MGDKQVSDLRLLDMTGDEAKEVMDSLTFEETTPEKQAELLAALPPADPDAPITVVTSFRLSLELKRRVDDAAAAEGISSSTFIRQAIEAILAGRDKENLVNLDDVIRAVRSVPHAA